MIKKRITILLLSAAIISIIAARSSEYIAEYIFARGIFKVLSVPLGFYTGILPFSIAEILLIALVLGTVGLIIWIIIKTVKGIINGSFGITKEKVSTLLWNAGFILSIIAFMFSILCGTNYYRYDFEKYCDFKVSDYTKEDLYELCVDLAVKTTNARKNVRNTDKNGIMQLKGNFYGTSLRASKAMRSLSEDYPSIGYVSGRAKPVLLSKYMSYTDIVGIYFPFTMEANVNNDVVDYNIPFSMCHELAHLSGYMKEDEANYIAYLACISSGDSEFIYSGYATALIYASNELYDIDKDKYYEVMGMLSEDVNKDMDADYEYWKKYEETEAGQKIAQVSNTVNDSYLVINGQEDGVQSYNKMVTLLIAEYKSK